MRKLNRSMTRLSFVFGAIAMAATPALAVLPAVKTVPWVPTDLTIPHDTYAGKTITLKGTSSVSGPTIQATWDFGDNSPVATFNVTDPYNVSATHSYSAVPLNTVFTARLTITDTSSNQSASKTYLVAMRNQNLQTKTNIAIDEGLWYLHTTLRRTTVGVINYGAWDSGGNASSGYYAATPSNIQAFEVNGHFENGPADNPYTEDVARGLKSVFSWLSTSAISANGPPVTLNNGNTVNIHLDGNNNGYAAYVNQSVPFYQGGMFIDAIVATNTPNAMTSTGPASGGGTDPGIINRSYKSIVQDLADGYLNCQYAGSAGGGWRYNCGDFPDNSACQWGAIALIAGIRGFGIAVDPNAMIWNQTWLTYSQDTTVGAFGYTGIGYYPWGPYADTPSGMVQLAMDKIGRGDNRWDLAETYMRDNFCNNTANGAAAAPRAYIYGLFSFTKSMLLHNPNGVLTPIQFLKSKTSGVSQIDWYAAQAAPNGTDPCDGVAATLIGFQNPAGYWYAHNVSGDQYPFETSFSIIMLRRTVFVSCVTNLAGRGTVSGTKPARIDLSWTGIPNVDHYNVLRGTAAGGPYSLLGNTTKTAYADSAGLQNGRTYYYVLQPIGAGGSEICQSNEAKITIPASR